MEQLGEIALYLVGRGMVVSKPSTVKVLSGEVMEFVSDLFEGTKRYSDLEYDCWKTFFT